MSMDYLEALFLAGIERNIASLKEIAECSTLEAAKPLADALVARDGFDAVEGFLRAGLDKSLPFGEELYQYIYAQICPL